MALPTVADAKAYLRLQTTAEDTLIAALLASAIAAIGGWLGRPIALTTRTDVIDTLVRSPTDASYTRTMYLPVYPVGEIVSVKDGEDVTIAPETLRASLSRGTIASIDTGRFYNPPYTIEYTAGLAARSDYALIEPAINQAILDTVADLYQRRNPSASSEREGGGVGVDYSLKSRTSTPGNYREDMLSDRVRDLLAPWRVIPG